MQTLLLIDEDVNIRKEIISIINHSNVRIHHIIECDNGEDAIELIKEHNIEAILMDVNLSAKDRITLIEEIQLLPNKPVLAVMSTQSDFELAVKLFKNGIKDYISKPLIPSQVEDVIYNFQKEIYARKSRQRLLFLQFRSMMFYDDISSKEIEYICDAMHEYLPVNGYVVFCLSNKDGFDLSEPGKYIYIEGVGHLDMIICDFQYKDEVLSKLSNYYIGVSGGYDNFYDVKQAFCEASTMRRTAFETCTKIVEADDYTKSIHEKEYGVKSMIQTANLICSKKMNQALEQLMTFVNDVKKRKFSINEFRDQMEIIISTTMKIYNDVLVNKEEDVKELLEMYSFQTIDDYMEVVTKWIETFDELVSNDLDSDMTEEQMQEAIEYIKDNFSTNLNMAVVSNHISMNYSLFSYTFKQYTGSNFVTYLKNIRVGEAKKLLTNTDMRINEISQAVGYEHEKHFMKTFKNITGLTPSQYRNSFKEK